MAGQAEIAGANVPIPAEITADGFDLGYRVATSGSVLERIMREVDGEDYLEGVEPYGMSTLWTLRTFATELEVPAGGTLVDVACGRAGVSLWLARETGADLIGVDWSPVGVAAATGRAAGWVGEGRARFLVGDLVDTGLPDGCADAVLCADAIFFASDRIAAVREAARLLRPGGRYAFTADEADDGRPRSVPDWRPIIEAGGLQVVSRIEIPRWRERLARMYELWLENLDEVRETFGDEYADELRDEAEAVGPSLPARTGVLYVARREYRTGTDSAPGAPSLAFEP
ncbi:class I SAM-dependent methyltransferase [Microbacterium sp. X-17]|uniref:class I SAM-dependent methyltransferase n=1 Tax=Microbacterium sp. X-17 TaxID=3144404 RepID=UPI0031F54DEA